MSKPEKVVQSQVRGFTYPSTQRSYTSQEAVLYALGVGALRKGPVENADELKFVYENHEDFCVLPTFGVVLPNFTTLFAAINACPGMPNFNPMMLLHGEQRLEIRKPLPASANMTIEYVFDDILDKGKGALLICRCVCKDEKGEVVAVNVIKNFIRGLGGFGGEKGAPQPVVQIPNRAPDATFTDKTDPNQAAIYRLSGDTNPLHIDPNMSAMGGFDTPILHGLCTYGHAARAVLKSICNNDVSKLKSIEARFSSHVFPGETLVTEMWKEGGRVLFQVKVQERGTVAISGGVCEVDAPAAASAPAPASSPAPAAAPASGLKSAPVFAAFKAAIAADPSFVSKVKAVYHFKISGPVSAEYTVDLKNGAGSVSEGAPAAADLVIEVGDDDYVSIAMGKLSAQKAFGQGKLKLKGNMMLAQKLDMLTKAARQTQSKL